MAAAGDGKMSPGAKASYEPPIPTRPSSALGHGLGRANTLAQALRHVRATS